ncbi:MAG: hypothetical protein KKH10_02950, partial [Gammaproteobacteria bacterium]|nr:hypothetical protein [Gammaproteobacteria bacterium]
MAIAEVESEPHIFETRNSEKGEAQMMRSFQQNSYLFGGNAPYVEEMYESYLDNPGSVP